MLSAAAGFLACGGDEPELPNLLLITVDELAADRLHCFGGPKDSGRSVCALAQGGTLYAWTVAPGAGEASAAATVLTGRPESVHGVGNDGQSFLGDLHPTIAEDLSKAGYATAAFVESPRVNRSRRLDRGFDLYDDRLASPSRMDQRVEDDGQSDRAELSSLVRAWIDRSSAPWFVWVHISRDAGLVELDRLLSGLSRTLNPPNGGPGVLFLALRGEAETTTAKNEVAAHDQAITWRTHRVPLIWRPAEGARTPDQPAPQYVSYRLTSPMDILPTLRVAAHLSATPDPRDVDVTSSKAASTLGRGRALGLDAQSGLDDGPAEERFFLLTAGPTGTDVGLASQSHLYIRRASPLDGTGRPVAASSLIPLDARFASLPEPFDPLHNAGPSTARFDPGPWRIDVLHPDSPVSRLEFHLARRLGAENDARRIARRRKNLQ